MSHAASPPVATPGRVTAAPRVRCRRLTVADAAAATALLAEGFPDRTPAWWAGSIARLQAQAAAVEAPGLGYGLEVDGVLAGILLLIYGPAGGSGPRRCNFSSWYVRPSCNAYAFLLVSQAARQPDMLFVNLSPAPHTWQTNEALGFKRYAQGQFMALAALAPRRAARVAAYGSAPPGDPLEHALVMRHIGYGALALRADEPHGSQPFLFGRDIIRGVLPVARLLYCRSLDEFVRLAGPLGRALLRRGLLAVVVDGAQQVPGLRGRARGDALPRLYKGPQPPRLGDLTDTEAALFAP